MPDITLKATIWYEVIQPYKIELTRSQKGTYGWTITVHAQTPAQAALDIESLDKNFRVRYVTLAPITEES